jgi:DNA-binding LytR/AlgR family response regulator
MLESAPLRLLIADDEPAARELLRVYAGRRPDVVVAGESEDGPHAVDAIIALRPELVLLDVEMPAMDGFTVLAELARRRVATPRVVFVTAFDRYAVRAFEANAVDYLLKPVTYERFGQAIDRCRTAAPTSYQLTLNGLLEDMFLHAPKRLLVRERDCITPVPIGSIDWIEADRDYVRIHVGEKSHIVEKTIGEMETVLAHSGFVRIHRGTIINLERAERLYSEGSGRYSLRMRDGTVLAVSRSYSEPFRKGLI